MNEALPVIDVYVVNHYFTKADLECIAKTLNNKKGFGSIAKFRVQVDNQKYYMAKQQNPSIVVLAKLSKEEIRKRFPPEDHKPKQKRIHNLSFTFLYLKPPVIVFNADNWNNKPEGFRGSQQEYLTYLINHEFGHALSLEHEHKTAKLCPLMYQQSLGTSDCATATVWPSKANLQQASEYIATY